MFLQQFNVVKTMMKWRKTSRTRPIPRPASSRSYRFESASCEELRAKLCDEFPYSAVCSVCLHARLLSTAREGGQSRASKKNNGKRSLSSSELKSSVVLLLTDLLFVSLASLCIFFLPLVGHFLYCWRAHCRALYFRRYYRIWRCSRGHICAPVCSIRAAISSRSWPSCAASCMLRFGCASTVRDACAGRFAWRSRF